MSEHPTSQCHPRATQELLVRHARDGEQGRCRSCGNLTGLLRRTSARDRVWWWDCGRCSAPRLDTIEVDDSVREALRACAEAYIAWETWDGVGTAYQQATHRLYRLLTYHLTLPGPDRDEQLLALLGGDGARPPPQCKCSKVPGMPAFRGCPVHMPPKAQSAWTNCQMGDPGPLGATDCALAGGPCEPELVPTCPHR